MFSFEVSAGMAFVAIFVYCMLLFDYSSRILEGARRDLPMFALFSLVNCAILAGHTSLNVPPFLFYSLCFTTLAIEFKIISKAKIMQIAFGAYIFTFHIALVQIPTVVIYSEILGVYPLYIFEHMQYRINALLVLAVFLILLLILARVIVKDKDVRRLSLSPAYASGMILFCFVSTFTVTLESVMLLTTQDNIQQVPIAVSTSLLSLIMFYFMFFYLISFVKMSMLKRESDKMETDYSRMLNEKKEIMAKATSDAQTGLYNRKFIHELLESMCKDEKLKFGVLFIDINKLKYVNDNFGHKAGDELIKTMAECVLSAIRETDSAARVGGDEFVVLLTDVKEPDIDVVLERIQTNIEKSAKNVEYPMSASIGGVIVDDEMRRAGKGDILNRADRMMMQRKSEFYVSSEGGGV